MYRIREDHSEEMEIKKSRFISFLHRCDSEEDAKAFVASIRKAHPNANHHCYAFIIGNQNEIQRSNDDGEPAGTAGSPMLECLNKQHMQDIVAVTVRYFGGIKLGAGGLIRAYSHSVSNALQHASLMEKVWMKKCTIEFSYDLIGKLDYFFRTKDITIIDKVYEEMVMYTFLSKELRSEELRELTAGTCTLSFIDDIIIEMNVIVQGE